MKRCCPMSDLAGTPVAVTHIKIGSREGAAVIDMVGGPAKCDIGMQSVNQQRRISDIDDAGAGDDREGRAGVARTRYAELIDEGGRAGNVGSQHYPERRDGVFDQRYVVRIDAERPVRNRGCQDAKREDEAETEADHLPAEGHDLFGIACAEQVAYQGAGCRGEGVDEHEDQRRYGPHDVRGGQVALAQVFDAEEEEEPREESHALLDHHPDRKAQDLFLQGKVESCESEFIAAPVGPVAGVEYVEESGYTFRNRRGDRSAGDAHFGESEFSEDQQVVQYDIGEYHDDRVDRQDARAGRADIECPEHRPDVGEEETVNPVIEVPDGGFPYIGSFDQGTHDAGYEDFREDEQHEGHQQQKRRALHEQRPDLRILLGSVAAGDENLGADAEPEAPHEDHQVEDTRQGRSPQLRFSDASQIGRICQSDQLLHQQADQHREGDFQDFLVRVTHWKRRFQCTKILFFPQSYL